MRVIILTNDHRVKKKGIHSGRISFNHDKKLYQINPEGVYLRQKLDKRSKPKPLSIYFENNSNPVRWVEANKDQSDESMNYLELVGSINMMKQSSGQGLGSAILGSLGAIAGLFSFYNIIMGVFALAMLSAMIPVIRGILGI